jgi:hypothetical protein
MHRNGDWSKQGHVRDLHNTGKGIRLVWSTLMKCAEPFPTNLISNGLEPLKKRSAPMRSKTLSSRALVALNSVPAVVGVMQTVRNER